MAQLNATTYGEHIKNEITDGIKITDTLEQVIISENGEFHQFDTIAENLMSDSIESMQLAPNGIVTDIYPAEGNEAGKINLLHDKDRKEISCYAKDIPLPTKTGYSLTGYFPLIIQKNTRNQPFKVGSGYPLISIFCLHFHVNIYV